MDNCADAEGGLGGNRYQRAFLDFFEDEMVRQGYNWKKVLFEFLLKGDPPLLNGLIGGRKPPHFPMIPTCAHATPEPTS